jgi:anaerobic magnesium-protoporphyrin IX monomethyl ester cyclase
MTFDRVFLIQPPSSSYLGAARPPAGLGYLAESLSRAGIECRVQDIRLGCRPATLRANLSAFWPDLIGISLVSFEYKSSYRLVRRIKEWFPQASMIAGGPHVSVLKESVLEQCPELDFALAGDGEISLIELCTGKTSYNRIPGLLYRRDGRVMSGQGPRALEDLDMVPFPRYANFDRDRYAREIPLVTSRGCVFRCSFCPNSLLRSRFHARSASHVVDEIEYWYSRGIRQFNIDDDNFALLRDRVYDICDEIEHRQLRSLFIRCANGLRASTVDRPLLARMREVGFAEVGIAADGGNDRVLLEIANKDETLETIERAIQDALSVGMEVKLLSILGQPGETLSDVEDSLALAERYPFLRVQLYNPIPYPGTRLFEQVQNHANFLIPPEEYLNRIQDNDGTVPVFETPELPGPLRRQLLRRARRIERAVTRRAVDRMFKDLPFIGAIAGWVFASPVGQQLFFKNRLVRRLVDGIWYRYNTRAGHRQPQQATRRL